ncbi:hypothetical protein Trydic_g2418 [Trypoxylus dichotomus]
MSITASSLLARLEELKKWQEKQQQRLLQQQSSRFESTNNTSSNYDTIEGLSEFNSSSALTKTNVKQIPLTVLSEKNANIIDTSKHEEMKSPVINASFRQKQCNKNIPLRDDENSSAKPKKPFLKRGSGLVRFKMNPGDQKRPFNKMIKRHSSLKSCIKTDTLNENTSEKQSTEFEVTPLKRPDVNFKAVWFKLGNDDLTKTNGKDISHEEILAKKTISQINEFAAKKIGTPEKSLPAHFNRISNEVKLPSYYEECLPKIVEVTEANPVASKYEYMKIPCNQPSEQSLYEQQLERELLIFEALEEKAMNSSFCSTSSSVLHIMSSTPSKLKNRSLVKHFMHEKPEHHTALPNNIIEEVQDDHLIAIEQPKPSKPINITESDVDKVSSLESSVTSEDLQEKSQDDVDFRDNIPWPDVNTYTRENSSLSSASLQTARSSPGEDTLVSESETRENKAERVQIVEKKSCESEVENAKDLLTQKLKALDDEIQNFRKENAKLQRAKLELEKEEREFKKEKKAFEKYVLEEKINVEFYLEDEKRKLAKEKMVFDRYVKEVHNKTTRKEREEVASLKEEVANLKEAAKLKETRNATSQARLRTQIKSFEREISGLREELENLRKTNAKLLSTQQITKKSTETKMLHEINKNLSKLTKDVKVNEKLKKMNNSIETKKTLLNSVEIEDKIRDTSPNKEEMKDFFYGQVRDSPKTKKDDQENSPNSNLYKSYEMYLKNVRKTLANDSSRVEHALDGDQDENVGAKNDSSVERIYERIFGKNVAGIPEMQNVAVGIGTNRDEMKTNLRTQEAANGTMMKDLSARRIQQNMTVPLDTSRGVNERVLPNGDKEITYPNGNIKTTSSDGNYISLKYYNGDVKETKLLEGIIKYYYAENQIWQTTMPDGSEILEFPTGQVEKKFKDGTTEIKFPNGVIRTSRPDGSESLSYPDQTQVEISAGGEKVMHLPNGQKEIHSVDHMRREYPDGTVKILYPDGIQETRYSSGRIRIKDRDGNLLLDSHDDYR